MKILSPAKIRRAVFYLMEHFDVSEWRICRVLNQPRSTQRYLPKIKSDEELLTEHMIDLATK